VYSVKDQQVFFLFQLQTYVSGMLFPLISVVALKNEDQTLKL